MQPGSLSTEPPAPSSNRSTSSATMINRKDTHIYSFINRIINVAATIVPKGFNTISSWVNMGIITRLDDGTDMSITRKANTTTLITINTKSSLNLKRDHPVNQLPPIQPCYQQHQATLLRATLPPQPTLAPDPLTEAATIKSTATINIAYVTRMNLNIVTIITKINTLDDATTKSSMNLEVNNDQGISQRIELKPKVSLRMSAVDHPVVQRNLANILFINRTTRPPTRSATGTTRSSPAPSSTPPSTPTTSRSTGRSPVQPGSAAGTSTPPVDDQVQQRLAHPHVLNRQKRLDDRVQRHHDQPQHQPADHQQQQDEPRPSTDRTDESITGKSITLYSIDMMTNKVTPVAWISNRARHPPDPSPRTSTSTAWTPAKP
ncbi:hypothetical protein BDK51DRAFT_44311 [Blyttiomyces helicus]|uniref:Uncharacterized protein n=1 Tax=Blyttiomyces helicus TaxID=388810 RepID=A0A4P9WL86_9FUNG|nr:hypothetical protein BDK51DRAFT_44311 [Blyttiomyces helicus]|eukprot:RKO93624.1 hypothetical protein BDK51DRAFT_44311 [Blyttiomyces helicus]